MNNGVFIPIEIMRREYISKLLLSVILIKKGMPFIKVDLLRKNPVGARLDPIYKILEKMNYDLSLIEFDRPINHKGSFKRLIFRKIRGIF